MDFPSTLVRDYWYQFLDEHENPNQVSGRFLEAFSIGNSAESANSGAQLILSGVKTATSSLIWAIEAAETRPPSKGDLSVVLNGAKEPVCVVETLWTDIVPFSKISREFAFEYGEWDRTLETWREKCWGYYADECKRLALSPNPDMPLLCERFHVVYPSKS